MAYDSMIDEMIREDGFKVMLEKLVDTAIELGDKEAIRFAPTLRNLKAITEAAESAIQNFEWDAQGGKSVGHYPCGVVSAHGLLAQIREARYAALKAPDTPHLATKQRGACTNCGAIDNDFDGFADQCPACGGKIEFTNKN